MKPVTQLDIIIVVALIVMTMLLTMPSIKEHDARIKSLEIQLKELQDAKR